jgi:signal transduction histidine kinase
VRLLPSLRNRMFVATALVAVITLASAIQLIATRITSEGEAELRRGLSDAADLAEKRHAQRVETLTLVARLIADLPKLKAAVETGDPPTVQPIAVEYREQVKADALVVTGPHGERLAAVGTSAADAGSVAQALAGAPAVARRAEAGRLIETVTVPVSIGPGATEVLGTLGLGLGLDGALAADLRGVTSSEIALVSEGRVLAATTPLAAADVLSVASGQQLTVLGRDRAQYAALARPLARASSSGPEVVLVLLRSPTERLRFMRAMEAGLLGAAVVALTLAVLLSYAVARSVTGPLASIAGTMREMTESGDLTREIPSGGSWDDEDARVLAGAFRALTDSLRRFQREAALKERLSALGRLSTVVAHEVRNPLMIIKASLRVLGRSDAASQERQEAVADIDQEVARLDRIVRDVLEYARPVTVVVAPTNVGALCRDAASAIEREGTVVPVEVAPDLPLVSTDAERLRRALVNLLTNARDAVAGRHPENGAPLVELRVTRVVANGAIAIEVEDRGTGITADDLPHVFEPYFSTKRTGTGLGLAITRNIVESLGGSISADSRPGEGTRVRIELPGPTA